LSAVLVIPFLPGAVGPEIELGSPAPYPIKSPVTTRFVSEIETRAAQEAAAAAVADVYRFDASITLEKRQALSDTLQVIEGILLDPELEREERRGQLVALTEVPFTNETLYILMALQEQEWGSLKDEVIRLYDVVTHRVEAPDEIDEIDEERVEEIRSALPDLVQRSFNPLKRILISDFVGSFLAPNFMVDEAATDQRREEARASTPPQYVDVLEGQLIRDDGEIIRERDLEILEAVGLRIPQISWTDVVGRTALVVGLVVPYSIFLYRFETGVVRSFRRLLFLGLMLVVVVVAGKFLIPGRFGFAYAFPLATASILLTLLLGPQVALGATIVLSVLSGYLGVNSLELTVLGIVGGLVGILGIWKAQRSNAFLFTGFYVTLANVTVLGAFRLIDHDLSLSGLFTVGIACTINGFSSAALSFATFGFLGTLFGQVTVLQLMELTNPNQPLLRRLMREAPGTYYHSIIVGNLAERAAEVVGADPLLARVGAFYHDVGKVVRPYFFIDNQAGRTNIHDDLPPRTSAQLITDHVRDGMALARKYRLPEQIVQFIPQHHGTTMATYFYRRALQEDETVDPNDFRYPGPKPQSKETAILMLADSVEATVRSMDQSGKLQEMLESAQEGEDPLDKLVGEIIDKRVRDGQLDECDLTFRDLNSIRDAFVDMLRGIYHRRIAYPELGKAKESDS
jgi:putative nucleotidyltransferase with HDIG domain